MSKKGNEGIRGNIVKRMDLKKNNSTNHTKFKSLQKRRCGFVIATVERASRQCSMMHFIMSLNIEKITPTTFRCPIKSELLLVRLSLI